MTNRFTLFSKIEREEMLLALDGVGNGEEVRRDLIAELIQCIESEHSKLALEIAQMTLELSAGPYVALASTQHEARSRVIQAAAVKVQAILNQQPK